YTDTRSVASVALILQDAPAMNVRRRRLQEQRHSSASRAAQANPMRRGQCPKWVDTVEKRFCGLERATLIQNRSRVRNFDSTARCSDSIFAFWRLAEGFI